MVGHSEIVGKPAAFMLMAEGRRYCVPSRDALGGRASRRADAVLVAVGKPKFLRADMVKPGAAVIDIGINPGHRCRRRDDDRRRRRYGRRERSGELGHASTGRRRSVTVAMFMRNAVAAHAKQLAAGWLG